MSRDAEVIVTRDLADLSSTAGDIATGIKHVGKWLGDAYEDGSDERVGPAIAALRCAHAALVGLIAELEALR